jgi:hypothetical protein
MNSIKCPQCGLVNWATEARCKRCGLSLENASEDAFVSIPAAEQAYSQWSNVPPIQTAPAQITEAALNTWKWFTVYCVFMAVLYFLFAIGGAIALLVDFGATSQQSQELKIYGAIYVVMGLGLMIPFAAILFLEKKSWVWIYGLVLIVLGLTSCCTWPATIPLLINWLKPETKALFGRI